MIHSPEFLKLVEHVRGHIREISTDEVRRRMGAFRLIDVREDHEWQENRIPGAEHLGKGIIERDIEVRIPDKSAMIVLYCGGGYRSALAVENLQRMGYFNVWSMQGGFREWQEKAFPSAGKL